MIAYAPWQAILDGLGWLLARLYDFIPNYGVAIILLTVIIRLLLLPLGVKQIRSMQATQALQPKLKALQAKYKGDRQRLYEETQKLYKEYGHNPLSGCLPLLLQLPVLIALFSVLRYPTGITHIPTESKLYTAIENRQTYFLGASLSCSALEAGRQVKVVLPAENGGKPRTVTKDCGHGGATRIPYFAFALLMVGTTYFQQRQMTKAAPAGSSSQQQAIMRIMPLLFGFWGFIFPAGLVVYWTTTNTIQIGQQWFLLHRRGAPLAPSKVSEPQQPEPKRKGGARPSSGGRTPTRESASRGSGDRRPRGGVVPRRGSGNGRSGGGGTSGRSGSNGGRTNQQRRQQAGGGGGDAGSRKKRPKR
jgi:YidC/Oxa1 family membrane protein insertase